MENYRRDARHQHRSTANGTPFSHGGEIASASAAERTWGAQPATEQRGYWGFALARLLSHAFKATCATEACVRRSLASNPQPTDRSPLTQGVTARHPQARTGLAEIRVTAAITGSKLKIRSLMNGLNLLLSDISSTDNVQRGRIKGVLPSSDYHILAN